MNNMESEQSIHLSEYFYIIEKHKVIIIASLVIMVTLTMLFSFLMKPVYRSTATMIFDKEQTTSPLTGERLDYESYVSQSLTFNTHFKLIKSRQVMEKVIRNLHLDRAAQDHELQTGFLKGLFSQFKKNIKLLLGKEEEVLTDYDKMASLVNNLKGKFDIENVRDTRLLKVSVDDHDSVQARNLANSLARVYIDYNISNRLNSSQNTLGWMTAQLYEMKKKLEDAEEEFMNYKQKEKIFSIQEKHKFIMQKIEEFNDAYIKARNKRLELDAKLAELNRNINAKGSLIHSRSIIFNSIIDNLYTQLVEAEVEFSRLGKVYKPKHPKMLQIKSKLDKTAKKLNIELKKEVENLKTERSVLFSREKVLENTMADFENDAMETNRKALKYSILERNVETNKKLYDTLLVKVKESNVVGNLDVSNIRIVEEAALSQYPVKPKKKRNLLLSIIFGLMTGIGLAFLIEYMDRTLRTEDDIRKHLDLPVLSVIPVADSEKQID